MMKMKFVEHILVQIPLTSVAEIGCSVGSQTVEWAPWGGCDGISGGGMM
jgi:hypothetical protein